MRLLWLFLLLFVSMAQLASSLNANYYQYPNGFSGQLGLLPLPQFMADSPQQQQQQQQQQQPPLVQQPQQTQQQQSQAQQQQPQQQQQQAQPQPQPPEVGPADLSQLGQPAQQASREQQSHSRPSSEREGPIFRYQGFAINSTSVKLVWNLLSGYHADYFDIEWGPIPEATHVYSVSKLNGSARDYTFHQLQPDTLYQFQLHGFNSEHIFKPQLVAVKTPPANFSPRTQDYINKDIMPLGVKAEAKSNSSIQLSWTEPEKPANIRISNRVNIIRYYVNPTSAQANSSGEPAISAPQYHYLNVTNARESRLIVQRLKPATEYAFAVKTAYYTPDMKRMFTQSGFSMDTIAKTFDIEPSAPRNFSIQALAQTRDELLAGESSKLELSWAPPESPNGQLKGYLILYANEPTTPDDKWTRIEAMGAQINNWFVKNLKPGYSYYFKVRAVNQRGQGPDSEVRLFVAPAPAASSQPQPPLDKVNMPIPANNVLLIIAICMVAILFLLFLVVSRLACGASRKRRKNQPLSNGNKLQATAAGGGARVATLARRRQDNNSKQDYWISAMDQPSSKAASLDKSTSDHNMAMVSIQRDSPQFATTQLAPALPDYQHQQQVQLMHQLQAAGHYQPGELAGAFEQLDSGTASALMTLSKRQQQQLQKFQYQFASTAGMQAPGSMNQAPSPHQQPPPPPPLNIEQQNQQHLNQPLYGTHQGHQHQTLTSTRSLRLHRPTLYDPVSGSFVQNNDPSQPPNYNAHHLHSAIGIGQQFAGASNTLQFHNPHQSSTLMSRRNTNTLRSFQAAHNNATYGQLLGSSPFGQAAGSLAAPNGHHQHQQALQGHQAVINQLTSSNYPSLPLKHVSAVRPQIMSSLEDQIETELAEKEPQTQQAQQQPPSILQQDQQQPSTIKQ